MVLRLTNSMSGDIEDFVPQDPNRVTMYVCGPTVYGEPHIGNMRPAVVYDTLYRYLRYKYGADHVEYASNYTDIDDKIINRANDLGVAISDITEESIGFYQESLFHLKVLEPRFRPRATAYVGEMIAMITKLIATGHAYEAQGGVWFHVPSSVSKSFEGDRQEIGDAPETPWKRDVRDFALWKLAKPGEPSWDSPWGAGRPGWHIECSAMIESVLGETIDIHAGGADLKFPHHEAENHQSICAHGKPLANYWIHNGMLNMRGFKMAKSRANTHSPRNLLRMVPGEAIRYFLMNTHYRAAINGDYDSINRQLCQFKDQLDSAYMTWFNLRHIEVVDAQPYNTVVSALENDLNTSLALASWYNRRSINTRGSSYALTQKNLSEFVATGRLLGFFNYTPEEWFQANPSVKKDEIERLISERNQFKEDKNWLEADRIRDQLVKNEIVLEDRVDGTFWRTQRGDVLEP